MALADVLWSELTAIRNRSTPFDPQRTALTIKAASAIVDAHKVALAERMFVKEVMGVQGTVGKVRLPGAGGEEKERSADQEPES